MISSNFGGSDKIAQASVTLAVPSADRLRLVVDSMSEGFGLLAPDFTILELNKEAMRIDGRRREEVVGQSHWYAYPGSEHGEIGKLYQKAMSERIPLTLEHNYDWSNGRKTWLETRVFPTSDGCLAVFFRDITKYRLDQDRLKESEQRFRAAVEAVDGIIWTNTPNGEMLGEQPGWQALTGQDRAAYEGNGWASAIHPDDALPTLAQWRRAVATRTPFIFEHRVRRFDGQWRLFSVRAVPVFDRDNSIVEWVGIHRDITETRAVLLHLFRAFRFLPEFATV